MKFQPKQYISITRDIININYALSLTVVRCGKILTVRKHHQKERSAVESCDFEMVPRSYCGIENNEFIEFTAQVLKCYILLTKKIVEIVSLCNKLQKTDFYDEC